MIRRGIIIVALVLITAVLSPTAYGELSDSDKGGGGASEPSLLDLSPESFAASSSGSSSPLAGLITEAVENNPEIQAALAAMTALMPSASSDSTASSSSAMARTALRLRAMICRAVS